MGGNHGQHPPDKDRCDSADCSRPCFHAAFISTAPEVCKVYNRQKESADKAAETAQVTAVSKDATTEQKKKANDIIAKQAQAKEALAVADLRLTIANARDQAAQDAAAVVEARAKLDTASPETKTTYDEAVKKAAVSKAHALELAYAPETVATLLAKDEEMADLVNLRLVEIPRGLDDWKHNFRREDGALNWKRVAGILLTAALLSLGGPFWYALLQNLLKLRPLLARKDEEQRSLRQTKQVTR